MSQYKVLVKLGGKMRTFKVFRTKEKALDLMTEMNNKFLSQAYERARANGIPRLSYTAHKEAISKVAVQY